MVIGPLGLDLIACWACDATSDVTMSCEGKQGVKGVWDDTKFGRGVHISWVHLYLKLLGLRASAAMCKVGTGVLYTCLGVITWGAMWVFLHISAGHISL